jgi:hypothetical protein
MGTVLQLDGDIIIRGALRVTGQTSLSGGADIPASDLEHQHRCVYAQPSGSASAAGSSVVHVVDGSVGTLKAFKAGSISACTGDAAITVNLHKNGVSVLSAAIVLDSTNTARVVETGTISSVTVVAGDVLEIIVTVNAGTGALGNGVFAYVDLFEEAA